jgi:hypothetical protein
MLAPDWHGAADADTYSGISGGKRIGETCVDRGLERDRHLANRLQRRDFEVEMLIAGSVAWSAVRRGDLCLSFRLESLL